VIDDDVHGGSGAAGQEFGQQGPALDRLAAAAIGYEEQDQISETINVWGEVDFSAFALGRHQTRIRQYAKMGRHGAGGRSELLRDAPGSKAVGSVSDQQPENLQPPGMTQS
jgi:hypothetical protein